VFLWEFIIPLFIYVFAYWRMFIAIRRQANVGPTHHQKPTATAKEPTPGTSTETTEPTNNGSTSNKNERDKGANEGPMTAESTKRCQGGQSRATGLSKAKINIVKTMIFITVIHVACLLPMDIYFFYRKYAVFIFTSAKEDYVIVAVCWFVCLLATLPKNFQTDLHEIFTEGWQ